MHFVSKLNFSMNTTTQRLGFNTVQESGTYTVIGVFYSKVYYQDETDMFRLYAYTDLSDPELFQQYVDAFHMERTKSTICSKPVIPVMIPRG